MLEFANRKPQKALTARFVETVADPGKYFDGHGLFLSVRPNGAKQPGPTVVHHGQLLTRGAQRPNMSKLKVQSYS